MGKTNNTYEIEVPFFPGFYNAILMDSDRLYDIADEMSCDTGKDISADDLGLDFKAYSEACCEAFIEAFESRMPSVVKEVGDHHLYSPREYNFSNDKLYASVTMVDGWQDEMLKFINDNEDWFEKKIKADWTSYDGFFSFMPNTVNEWKEELSKDNPVPTFIEVVISYMMLREHGEDIAFLLAEEVVEQVYMEKYVSLNDK